MEIGELIKNYFKALEEGNCENMLRLFTEDAIIFSPLYGKKRASDFYRDLFKDTSQSKITLLNFLKGETEFVGAGHFQYDWILNDGTSTSFECVDVFQFAKDGRIRQVSIIYDTAKTKPLLRRSSSFDEGN